MKKLILILIAGFLSACGYANYSEVDHSGFKYTAKASSIKTIGKNDDWAWGRSDNSQTEANNYALQYCRQYYGSCALTYEGNRWVYDGPIASSSTSYSSSSSSSSSTSKTKPRLYYDSFSGGMRECAYDSSATGKCWSFKPYNASLFDKDTLFYDPSTGKMKTCLGVITVTGKCTSFGMFNHSKATADKGQLYYDSKNKKMTTCSFVTLSGECTMYDLVPNKWSKSPGVFKEPGSDITFKEPGSDIIFKEPGSDIIFKEPGSEFNF